MVERSKEVEASLGAGVKEIEENEKESVVLQRRCLRVTINLLAKHILKEEDLTALRPAPMNSYEPYRKSDLIGSTLITAKTSGDAIFEDDIKQ